MKLTNTTIIYEYDLSGISLELSSDLAPDETKVFIHFKNGEFQEVRYKFYAPYTEWKWEILALINEKIKEIKESYKQA